MRFFSRFCGMLAAILCSISFAAGALNVRDFGAQGDGITKDTAAIQKAIDAAEKQGGGTVMVPPGKYLSGTIHLKSYVTLYLDNGATILGSTDNADYDPYETLPYATPDDRETTYFHFALLAGENVENIAITGEGVIDGNRPRRGGPKPIALKLCRHVAIRGITIRRAPNYAISLLGTDYVDVDGVTIVEAYADGIDPDSSRFVRISNLYFEGWDDAIVAKASLALGYRRSTENLTVTNCVLTTNSCYLKFGSETGGDFKNVAFTNCALYRRRNEDPRNLAAVSLEANDGGIVDGVVISNIVAQDVYMPFAIKSSSRNRGSPPQSGTVRNVSIDNFVSTGASVAARITGLEGRPIQNVSLSNVTISVKRPKETAEQLKHFAGTTFRPQPAYALMVHHVEGLKMANVLMRWEDEDTRPAMIARNVRDLVMDGFRTDTVAGSGPVLLFESVAGALIQGCRTARGAGPFLRVGGAGSEGIHLLANDLSRAGAAVEFADGAPSSAVRLTGNLVRKKRGKE